MVDLYTKISENLSKNITKKYSTSFSLASTLFSKSIRQDIYNIYGFVRVADEVVDTYSGGDAKELIDQIEQQITFDLKRNYSTNPVFHAFVLTANKFNIDTDLIIPFLNSMRMDTDMRLYNSKLYEEYIYGSAEVVGLMCLKVFCNGNNDEYKKLKSGARALGSAFQKINFLRDIKDDHDRLGRYYFPIGSYENFDDETKNLIIKDINKDFEVARNSIKLLPKSAKSAVQAAYTYYDKLLNELNNTPANELKNKRIRINNTEKIMLLAKIKTGLKRSPL